MSPPPRRPTTRRSTRSPGGRRRPSTSRCSGWRRAPPCSTSAAARAATPSPSPRGFRVVGVDLAAGMLVRAQVKACAAGVHIAWVQADLLRFATRTHFTACFNNGMATDGKGAVPERSGAPGPAFYDDDAVFATYTAHRHRPGNPNDTLEGPAFLAMLGPIEGLRVVDLGCGDAGFGRALLDAGCAAYTGVDGSRRMCAAASRTLAGTAGRVVR